MNMRWIVVMTVGLLVVGPVGVGFAEEFADQPDDETSYVYCADDDVVYDDEFAEWLAPLLPGATDFGRDLVIVFTQCHGGGMLDEITEIVASEERVALFSASSFNESAWSASPFDSPGCLRGCGLKRAESYHVAAMAEALAAIGPNALSMSEVADWIEQHDEAAPGGAATDPAVCPGEDLVTEAEHPQSLFLNGGGEISLGQDRRGQTVSPEGRWAILFVGDPYEIWALNDLERFYTVLVANGFPDENILVLAGLDPASDPVSDEQPLLEFPYYVDQPATRVALRQALADVAAGLSGRSSQFLFWSTGHGNREDRLPWNSAPELAPGATIQGVLSPDDPQLSDGTNGDLFRFTGQAGTAVQVSLRSEAFDTYLFLYDSERQVIDSSDDEGGGTDSWLSVELPVDGSYYLLANSYESARGPYTMSIQMSGGRSAEKPGIKTGSSLVLGVPVTGELTASDSIASDGSFVDNYSIDLRDDNVYTVSLTSERFDAFLWVYDPLGALVAASDDVAGSNAQMLLFPPISGTYRIDVSSFAAGETGGYTVSASSGIDAAAVGARRLQVGMQHQGALAPKDLLWSDGAYYDLYQVGVAAGDRVSIRLTSTAIDPYLFVVDERGRWMAEDDDSAGGRNALATFTAPADGTYSVIASSFSPGEQGSYSIDVLPAGAGEPLRQAKPPVP